MANSPTAQNFPEDGFDKLLASALGGSADAVQELLESCRPYLLLISNQELEPQLQPKVGASDIVQETMISAERDFQSFHGKTRNELLAWLRGILRNDLRETRRSYGTAKREIARERPIQGDSLIGRPSVDPSDNRILTPSAQAMSDEECVTLQHAIQQLPTDYRKVIQLRTWEQLPFEEVGKQMNRSADAARKLWARAILLLQAELGEAGDGRAS